LFAADAAEEEAVLARVTRKPIPPTSSSLSRPSTYGIGITVAVRSNPQLPKLELVSPGRKGSIPTPPLALKSDELPLFAADAAEEEAVLARVTRKPIPPTSSEPSIAETRTRLARSERLDPDSTESEQCRKRSRWYV
jgi:hypothetical protein